MLHNTLNLKLALQFINIYVDLICLPNLVGWVDPIKTADIRADMSSQKSD